MISPFPLSCTDCKFYYNLISFTYIYIIYIYIYILYIYIYIYIYSVCQGRFHPGPKSNLFSWNCFSALVLKHRPSNNSPIFFPNIRDVISNKTYFLTHNRITLPLMKKILESRLSETRVDQTSVRLLNKSFYLSVTIKKNEDRKSPEWILYHHDPQEPRRSWVNIWHIMIKNQHKRSWHSSDSHPTMGSRNWWQSLIERAGSGEGHFHCTR